MRVGLSELAAAARETVLPPDPGLLRWFAALRATLAALLSFALVVLLGTVLPLPTPLRILGFAIGLFAGATVHDPTPRAQAVTIALVPVTAFVGTAAASVLYQHQWAAEAVTALIAFAVTYGALRGPRWGPLGMVGFIGYIIGLVTRLPPDTLPLRLGVICLAAACTALVRFVLVPENPQAELDRLRRDIRRGISSVLGAVAEALRVGRWTARTRRLLRRHADRLGTSLVMAEARIGAVPAAPPGLGLHLLETDLAVERIADLARRELGPPEARPALCAATGAIEAALAADRLPPVPESGPSPLGHALAALARIIGHIPQAGAPPAPLAPPPAASGLRPAIQAALAVLLAVGIGQYVSPRWYWAAFAAFATFQGTRSRGESIMKMVQFMAGTVAGVAAGVVMAALLAGHPLATLAVIVLAVFLAFQAFLAAYGVMMFWITIILGLLFGLLGYFPPELLVLRLKETAVGAGCGVLVACLVMARPHRAVVDEAAADLLRAIDDTVKAAVRSLLEAAPDALLSGALLALESRFIALREAVRPQLAGLGAARHATLRRRMLVLTACESWAREVGRIALHPPASFEPGRASLIRASAERIDASVDRLIRGAPTASATETAQLPAPVQGGEASARAVRLLLRLDLALAQMSGKGE